MQFRKLADFLWPIGATVLALLVMPLAIEQYPDFFKENLWPLPISVAIVVSCWILPFFLHARAKGILEWAKAEGWIRSSLAGVIAVSILLAIAMGSVKLFRFHNSHLASVLRKKERRPELSASRVLATDDSQIIARFYAREISPQPPATELEYKPFLREFFYDWVLKLAPDGQTGEITVIIKDLVKHKDRVRVIPDIASVSELTGKWMSGFDEPGRKPDYYESVIRFPSLDKDRPARIVFRRPIDMSKDEVTLKREHFSRSFEVIAGNTEITKRSYDENQQFNLLQRQLRTLFAWQLPGSNSAPLPIRKNFDDHLPPLAKYEVDITYEVSCGDAACEKVYTREFEGRNLVFR